MEINFIKRYIMIGCIVWTLICSVALIFHLREDYLQVLAQARTRAVTTLERDLLYRNWAASHGGVYALVSETMAPNPYLEFLPDRDVETSDGRKLTLINHTYMTRLVFDRADRFGKTISNITSLNLLNSGNAPDPWEKNALLQLEQGDELVSGTAEIDGQPYVRVMRPFYVDTTCLRCHEAQGYKIGDVRGGISVSIPFGSFLPEYWQHKLMSIALFCLLWLVGLAGLNQFGRKLFVQTGQAIESERLRDHAEMSLNYMSNYDRRTNLPNRFKFEQQLHETFQQVKSTDQLVAVTVLELGNYKQIIDNFDHPVGDDLFKMMAERVADLLAPGDAVARFGEDRLVFSCACRDEQYFSEEILPKLYSEVSKSLDLKEHSFFPVAYLGAALYPADASDAKRLVQKAELSKRS